MKHSLVIPVYNESPGIPALVARVASLCDSLRPDEVEVIFVNDGSRDGSVEALDAIAARDARLPLS